MTSAQVVETSVTNNSRSGDYSNPDDHNQPTIVFCVVILLNLDSWKLHSC